jgi:hypothetical protein
MKVTSERPFGGRSAELCEAARRATSSVLRMAALVGWVWEPCRACSPLRGRVLAATTKGEPALCVGDTDSGRAVSRGVGVCRSPFGLSTHTSTVTAMWVSSNTVVDVVTALRHVAAGAECGVRARRRHGTSGSCRTWCSTSGCG